MDNAAATNETIDGEVIDIKVEQSDAPPPKRKGKPKSTSGKQAKADAVKLDTMPPEILEIVALAPVLLTMVSVKYLTTEKDAQGNVILEGIQLRPNEAAMAACAPAFKTWLSTLDIELTPGWALLSVYAIALASSMPDAMGQMKAREEAKNKPKVAKEANANPSPEANAVNGSEQANPAPIAG